MKKDLKWIVGIILFAAVAAYGAKLGEDLFKIGKPGSSSDKILQFGQDRDWETYNSNNPF